MWAETMALWEGETPEGWLLLGLALYGLVQLLMATANGLRHRLQPDSALISVVVLVRNQEEQVEGVVQYLMSSELATSRRPQFLLVDCGSTDDTPRLIDRLAVREPGLGILTLVPEDAESACDTALLMCSSPIALVVDLRYPAHPLQVLRVLQTIWK